MDDSKIVVEEGDLFDEDEFHMFAYSISFGTELIVESVGYATEPQNLTEKEKITWVKERLDSLLQLPKVANMPEPIRSCIVDSYVSTYGMVFKTVEDEEKLLQQIEQYNMENYITVGEEGTEENVTVYMGVSSKFNFVGIDCDAEYKRQLHELR